MSYKKKHPLFQARTTLPLLALSLLLPACGNEDPDETSDAFPPPCSGVTGKGTTWLTDPTTGVSSPLRCLASDSDTLSGRFVQSVEEVSEPSTIETGTVAHESSREYFYPISDPFASHVEAYYIATEVGIAALRAASWLQLEPVSIRTGPFCVAKSMRARTSIILGRGGMVGDAMDASVVAHEYGHHVISSAFSPGMEEFSMTLFEGLADYVACHIGTQSPLSALVRPCGSDATWPEDKVTLSDFCPGYLQEMQQMGLDSMCPDEYAVAQQACSEHPNAVEVHDTGLIVSSALLQLDTDIGAEVTLAVVLEAMRKFPSGTDFGGLRTSIINADKALFGGAHAAKIQSEFERRGMTEDVGLIAEEQL